MELPDFLTRNASSHIASQIPDLGEALTGQFDPEQYAGRTAHRAEHRDALIKLGDNLTKGPKWHEALGAFSGVERRSALDLLGFERQVVFSSFCARLIFAAGTDDIAYGAAAAHNRSMAEFCEADPRLIGVAMVPLHDPVRALVEIEHALNLGLGAVWIAADAPGGRSPGHPELESIWATLAEASVPFILHVGSSAIPIADEWMNDGKADTISARGGAEVIGSKDLSVIHFATQRFLSALILDGVLDTHPQLRGGVIEIGAGWVPDMIRRLDHAVEIWARSEPQLAKMTRKPSEQVNEQLRFTPYPFENVAQLTAEAGEDIFMFSTDYPHAEGGRDPIGRFDRSTGTLTDAQRAKFFSENFCALYFRR